MNEYQVQDLVNIMGVKEGMIRLLPLIDTNNQLNPWASELNDIFAKLQLDKEVQLIDLACGCGGYAVDFALNYNIRVVGYDILKGYIDKANEYAIKKGVKYLCRFEVQDIRHIADKYGEYDILTWIAPPHIWGESYNTIKHLRNSVKDMGYVVIADAYLYNNDSKKLYPTYEIYNDYTKGIQSYGDEIIFIKDYKGELWENDYESTKQAVKKAIEEVDSVKDKSLLKDYLLALSKDEVIDKEHLGLFVLIVQVHHKN